MIFPKEKIIYQSPLTEREVMERLKEFIEPKQFLRLTVLKSQSKPYEGSISRNQFHISRVLSYRNSFQPKISGKVKQLSFGTSIEVEMRLHRIVLVFVAIWCAFVAVMAGVIISINVQQGTFSLWPLLPLGLLYLAYYFTRKGFKLESYITKKNLQKLFEADIV